ncbi:MAG: bifunctional methylenetetrahydrofolate dehydrogenase/methenyltetrahydrofolate cyclohydrolase FolD [Candidatus Paracaedibacteraceae bacterium]|nr:bifunctional methylenetetrahydrofolate dehydrogenase/methenyltetrahydrofolate cyclohydrolase FolD [Candidatus Paracaedibacteraceae bacterium]
MIIDGERYANELNIALSEKCNILQKQYGRAPSLHVVLIGENPASQVYVKMKQKRAEEIGVESVIHLLDENVSQKDVLWKIQGLNVDEDVDGILVQMPLPAHLNTEEIIEAVNPKKDVDGLTSANLGKLLRNRATLMPCTPLGCMYLLKQWRSDLAGLHAVIVGRSILVGKPLGLLLSQANVTVTTCHSKTKNLAFHTQQADILIAACGIPNLIGEKHVKPGACVIDVGITKLPTGKLYGDVDFNAVKPVADAITPVPFGVGPMTVSYLMANTILAMEEGVKST